MSFFFMWSPPVVCLIILGNVLYARRIRSWEAQITTTTKSATTTTTTRFHGLKSKQCLDSKLIRIRVALISYTHMSQCNENRFIIFDLNCMVGLLDFNMHNTIQHIRSTTPRLIMKLLILWQWNSMRISCNGWQMGKVDNPQTKISLHFSLSPPLFRHVKCFVRQK